MSPQSLRSKVEQWVRKIGSTPVEIQDPQAEWHLQIDYPTHSAHPIHIVSPKGKADAIVIVSALGVGPEHLEVFEELDDDAKADFAWELRRTLNVIDVDFQLDGIKKEDDCPTRLQLSVTRYEDGLNLDSFARSVGAVYKTELNAVLLVQRLLGPKGLGGGGRFDFKRLGY